MDFKKIIICLFITIVVTSCNFFVRNGGLGTSINIEDSKERNVFVEEYKSEAPIIINDSIKISIKYAWVEYVWRYAGEDSQESEIENKDAYQLVIICDEKSIQTFNESWSIGDSQDSIFYNGYETSLITRLKEFRGEDTLKWKLVSKRFQKKSPPQNSIGTLVLVKAK